MYDIAATL